MSQAVGTLAAERSDGRAAAPIYIQNIRVTLESLQENYSASVLDVENTSASDTAEHDGFVTRQGPLASDGHINIGTFRTLTQRIALTRDLPKDHDKSVRVLELNRIPITVIASYGPSGGMFAAQRMFYVDGEDHAHLRPTTVDTRQLTGRFGRRRAREWLYESL